MQPFHVKRGCRGPLSDIVPRKCAQTLRGGTPIGERHTWRDLSYREAASRRPFNTTAQRHAATYPKPRTDTLRKRTPTPTGFHVKHAAPRPVRHGRGDVETDVTPLRCRVRRTRAYINRPSTTEQFRTSCVTIRFPARKAQTTGPGSRSSLDRFIVRALTRSRRRQTDGHRRTDTSGARAIGST